MQMFLLPLLLPGFYYFSVFVNENLQNVCGAAYGIIKHAYISIFFFRLVLLKRANNNNNNGDDDNNICMRRTHKCDSCNWHNIYYYYYEFFLVFILVF